MFGSVELAARIERAECRLIADACACVAGRVDGVITQAVAGGLAAWAGPSSPLNKVAGLGFAELDESAFVGFEQAMAARGAAVQVELSTLGDPALGKWLTGCGYRLVGVENVLARSLPLDDDHGLEVELDRGIELAESGADELDTWVDTVVDGFLTVDEQGVPTHESFERELLVGTMRDFNRGPAMVRYLARRWGQPAGGATMRVADGIAQLCGASTLPKHRRRGIQSALLERRLFEAGSRGCTIAVATTLPGSKSQQNMQRRGFALLYARNILVLEPS